MDYSSLSNQILKVYREMSDVFGDFQQNTKLTCLDNCGRCCLSREVEAAPLEMLPLCLHFLGTGDAFQWYEELEKIVNIGEKICVLYHPESADKKRGRCGYYQFRATICRTFGVWGILNKKGKKEIAICRYIREDKEHIYREIVQDLDLLERLPVMQTWSMKLATIDMSILNQKMPINHAIYHMLQKVMLYSRFTSHQYSD